MSGQEMTWERICRLAGGRRHHNAVRQFRAAWRWRKVAQLYLELGSECGALAQIARMLGVSESTISQDLAALREL